MAQLNAGIILQGQQPDIMGSMARGAQTRQMMQQAQQQNALAQLYQQHGAGMLQGDQTALNALAAVDPKAALGLLGQRQDMAARDLNMQHTQQRMDILTRDEERQIAAHAAKMSEMERAQAVKAVEDAVKVGMGLQGPQEWDAYMAQNQPELVGRFNVRKALANKFLSMAEIIKNAQPPKPADEYERYVAEEKSAGRQPLDRIQYAQAKKGKGFSVRTPDGTVVEYGGGSEGPGVQPSSPQAMISSIDGILSDPALDTATGVFSFLQAVPGTPQRRFGARAAQLEGQAFLQAFESLKGGGQITEIEGQKATQAIGRLDTTQSPGDYRDALTELRDLLSAAQARPQGWAQQQAATQKQDAAGHSDSSR